VLVAVAAALPVPVAVPVLIAVAVPLPVAAAVRAAVAVTVAVEDATDASTSVTGVYPRLAWKPTVAPDPTAQMNPVLPPALTSSAASSGVNMLVPPVLASLNTAAARAYRSVVVPVAASYVTDDARMPSSLDAGVRPDTE
jgi:hypothetical protein